MIRREEITPKGGSNHTFDTEHSAAFRYRLGALIYDTIVLCGVWIFSIVVIVTIGGKAFTGAPAQTLCFVEAFAFYCYFWMHKGQTIGMLAWRLRLETEGIFTLRKALLRFCGELLSIFAIGLGYFWIWIDKDRRSWSDILSGSVVVRYRKRTNTS